MGLRNNSGSLFREAACEFDEPRASLLDVRFGDREVDAVRGFGFAAHLRLGELQGKFSRVLMRGVYENCLIGKYRATW